MTHEESLEEAIERMEHIDFERLEKMISLITEEYAREN